VEALYWFVVLFALLFLGMPISFGLAIVGFVGFGVNVGWVPAASMVAQVTVDTADAYDLSVLPLFVLMGSLVSQARLSEQLYAFTNALVGHRRGGLAMATVMACGGFAAVCGSSLATAATMSKVTMPSMRRYRYSDELATASIAAGGTLGILIPPSIILVIYGVMTESDIGKLFIAGILPGILGVLLYMGAVAATIALNPLAGPPGERASWLERARTFRGIWGVVALFALVMGGIYGGVFTPTEAAGIGAVGAFVFALVRRTLTFRMLFEVLLDTARTTGMLMFLVIAAMVFSNLVIITGAPNVITNWMTGLDISPLAVIFIIVGIYVALGCVFESLAMMLVTVPLFYPLVQGLGFDLIWFGIIIVVVIEISMITPPIGVNVFVLKSAIPDVPMRKIFIGLVPFIGVDIVRVVLLVLFPGIALYLPSLMR